MPKNDYQTALHIINTLSVSDKAYISFDSLPNFRKYLREIIFKRSWDNQYTTRLEGEQLKVIRIR